VYDPYVESNDASTYICKSELSRYDVVFNSAMFEHVLCREDLDAVRDLLKPGGVLIVHTVVCDRIPKDPEWFYLKPPVHTAFHTNKSMSFLMEQWGFRSSIYCPKGKAWFLLPSNGEEIKLAVDKINLRLRNEWFIFKQGFVDYWK
jgi:2-polyprenyl-3-methyl-5-hydroxy-6-metoxy-1,4-benzoquinol methylase